MTSHRAHMLDTWVVLVAACVMTALSIFSTMDLEEALLITLGGASIGAALGALVLRPFRR